MELSGKVVEVVKSLEKPSEPLQPIRPFQPLQPLTHAEHPLRVELEELIDGVIKNVELRMENADWVRDPVLKKRFRTIVSARLRDVRDAAETKEMLMRSVKVGGLGITPPAPPLTLKGGTGGVADAVVEIIEKAFGEFQTKWKTVEENKRQEWLKKQQERAGGDENRLKKEEADLEARYRKLAGQQAIAAKPARAVEPASPVTAQTARQPQTVSRTASLSIPPKAQIPISRPSTMPPAQISQPVALPPKSYPSPPRPSGKITDVRPAPKLLGPLEELSSLTLKDFRRLGTAPQEAVQKISSKIEFLGRESLTRKMQGIAAWQKSPLYQQYSSIMRQSLKDRTSPEATLARFAGQGQETLTKEEWYAIMELNQKLRF